MTTPMKEFVIRPMLCEDLVEVLAIERCTHSPAWSRQNFVSELRNACAYAFVAHDGQRLLGYLAFWMICDEVHLLNLAIHPDFRGCGIGGRLMRFLIHFSHDHGAKWIGLEVRRSNHKARAMYCHYGFREKDVRQAYYQNNREDGIVMECRLDREPI